MKRPCQTSDPHSPSQVTRLVGDSSDCWRRRQQQQSSEAEILDGCVNDACPVRYCGHYFAPYLEGGRMVGMCFGQKPPALLLQLIMDWPDTSAIRGSELIVELMTAISDSA